MKTSYLNFAVGLLYGFGLGVLLDKASLVNGTTFSILIIVLFVVPSLVWFESYTHRRRVEQWERIAKKGRSVFIIFWYVLIRGAVLSAILMYALRGNPPLEIVHEITIPVIALVMGFIGYQEWENCTRDSLEPPGLRRYDLE